MPSYTVCIVEDNAECAAALIDKVAASPFSEGFEVHEMASRAELEYFVSEGHAVDILITDTNLGTDAADGISMVRDLFPAGSKPRSSTQLAILNTVRPSTRRSMCTSW